MLQPGDVLQNRYRVLALLGQGGMGAVYRAWDTRLTAEVALKEMTIQPGLDPDALVRLREQFRQEATVLARLKHPSLVGVIDFFEERGNVHLVMQFVTGQDLAGHMRQYGALPEQEVLALADQLLDALAYCHDQGILHRDIKPQNVIIQPNGRPVLVDFGLVKLWNPLDPSTRTAMRGMGTPEYAPPEQYEVVTSHTDPRSDIYSVGATLYHALTGQAPPTATLRIAVPSSFQPPRSLNPSVSPRTEAVVLRATELALENRFRDAREMAAALRGQVPVDGATVRRPAAGAPVSEGGSATALSASGRRRTRFSIRHLECACRHCDRCHPHARRYTKLKSHVDGIGHVCTTICADGYTHANIDDDQQSYTNIHIYVHADANFNPDPHQHSNSDCDSHASPCCLQQLGRASRLLTEERAVVQQDERDLGPGSDQGIARPAHAERGSGLDSELVARRIPDYLQHKPGWELRSVGDERRWNQPETVDHTGGLGRICQLVSGRCATRFRHYG